MKKHLFGILAVLLTACMLLTNFSYAAAGSKGMSIKISNTKRTVAAGGKLKLNAKIIHGKKGAKLAYSSSQKKIATVNAKGVVSGKKAGKTKITVRVKGEKIKKVITVTVRKASKKPSKTTPKPTKKPKPTAIPKPTKKPSPSEKPQASESPGVSQSSQPSSDGQVTEEPTTQSPQPSESASSKPQVSDKPSVSPSQGNDSKELIRYQAVMDIDGEKTTVFLINKKYEGSVRFNFNGKEFSYNGKAGDVLRLLANSATTITNSAKTIRLSRKTDKNLQLEKYWTVEDLEDGSIFQFRAETNNTVKPEIADCGAIFFRGDVTYAIKIY